MKPDPKNFLDETTEEIALRALESARNPQPVEEVPPLISSETLPFYACLAQAGEQLADIDRRQDAILEHLRAMDDADV